MAENEADTAVAEENFQYNVKIEDAGPATKKVSVEIPQERIASKLAEQFKELRQQAAIPGFRPGHAPAKLVERRFGDDVKEQVRRSLISESYEQAVEKNSLQVLGEPQFSDPEAIKLPDSGSMTYNFEIEVQPDINIPELKGIKVKKPKINVNDANVDQAMSNLREQQGTLVPIEDRGVQDGDYLVADVHIKMDGAEVGHQQDAQVVSRPGRIGGIQIDDLDKQLKGLKPGDKKEISVKGPDTHANEALRGKDLIVEVALKDIKKLELAELTPQFLEELGFENEKELREALREQMVERITFDVQTTMRNQVSQYLIDNVQFELPSKLSDRQADRVVQRRAVDLMMRGMPRDQVEANIERLKGGAKDEAVRELKLFFILQKIATDQNVDIDEAELNGRIAMIAAQRGRRPEKVKQEMSKDGSLSNLYVQMREQKAIDKILETAEVEEVEVDADKDKEKKD